MNGFSEDGQVSSFLASAALGPAVLLIEGEVGIGKTTAWVAACEEARRAGFRVLSARANRDGSGLAFGIASELIADVEAEVVDSLPEMQRIAAERNLLHVPGDRVPDDRRAVVAAFTAIVNKLSDATPVLVAVDDVQWLDADSRDLLAFAARRLRGRVGLLLTEGLSADGTATWLTLHSPDTLSRMRIRPMDSSRLQRVVTDRMGRSLSRPTMSRIVEVSGGNPFYALELARALNDTTSPATAILPPALAEIIRHQVGRFDDEVKLALLAGACVGDPTVDLMAAMTSTTVEHLVELLEEPEQDGVVAIEGNRVRFTHPVLAYGVYSEAPLSHRRRMHRALADLERAPEQRARHLALAEVDADPDTLLALDEAARTVGLGGDPVAAAELVELAIGLGGGTPARRLDAARHHLRAGELDRARAQAESAATVLPAGEQRAVARLLVAGTLLHRGEFGAAAKTLRDAMADLPKGSSLQVRAHLSSAMAQSSLGNGDVAQRHSMQAMTRAERLDDPHLLSQALAVHVALQCRRGLGLDQPTLDRAMRLEDPDADVPAAFSARAVGALVLGWTGRLSEAAPALADTIARSASRGTESDVLLLEFHAAMVDVWLGRYADAARTAEDMTLRAEQIGGSHVRILAAVPGALAAAYAGREQDARKEVEAALTDSSIPEGQWTTTWPSMALGFLEVSLGNYAEALNALQPSLSRWRHAADTDISTFLFIPDAVEAMVGMDDFGAAEDLVSAMESRGARLNHPWMSAVGARCRSMLLAAEGDLDGAQRAALLAMAEHEHLAAPFERARTQLFLGELQRRLRRRQAARTTIGDALKTFADLGAPIWADRAAQELARVGLPKGHDSGLTPGERRVAELAATGMTNKDVAAALFISPKTVERNLGRVYRKLGIRTRVELIRGVHVDDSGPAAEERS
ncbi:LuxR family transcriptional regulator [Mycolicibacterium sp. P1-18]|uniref:helix-turn-helix transcriptional regulator n=1 Tax=Mycolicibacterium sp. P1-18 TaxID=2024615 RepID=UPI0015653AB2|nr:AAA family ATPase [Mycolicibacterium sp. P1-18]